MPLRHYGVLAGRVTAGRIETRGMTPHHHVRIDADTPYRAAVNVRANIADPRAADLLYLIDPDFQHPVTAALPDLPAGWTPLPSRPDGLALDYVRGNLFDPKDLRRLPATLPGPENDLNDALADQIRRALGTDTARLYAFGQRWGPEPGDPDQIFGFDPGNGVHDIHLNQGNDPSRLGDNGVWQDGALLLHLPADRGQATRWVAIFLAFQTQSWRTDDRTGAALPPTERDAAPHGGNGGGRRHRERRRGGRGERRGGP